jgi:hypothetical protein
MLSFISLATCTGNIGPFSLTKDNILSFVSIEERNSWFIIYFLR